MKNFIVTIRVCQDDNTVRDIVYNIVATDIQDVYKQLELLVFIGTVTNVTIKEQKAK